MAADTSKLSARLEALFSADRALRERERDLLSAGDRQALVTLLCRAREQARQLDDPLEAGLRLERLADLYAQVASPETTEALVALLDEDDPSVRVQAADALVDVAEDRYPHIVRAIDRRLGQRDAGQAMRELPWVLAEIGEADTLTLLERFLGHPAAEVVASAIEALAYLGVPESAALLERLRDDTRSVELDDLEGDGSATLGELAREAIDELSPSDKG